MTVADGFNLLLSFEVIAKQRTCLLELTGAMAITLSVSARHLAKDAPELSQVPAQSIDAPCEVLHATGPKPQQIDGCQLSA